MVADVVAEAAITRTPDELVDAVLICQTVYVLGSITSIGHFQPSTTKVLPYFILWPFILLWVIHFKGFLLMGIKGS